MRFRIPHARVAIGFCALAASLAAGCAPSGYYRVTQDQLDSLLTTQAELVKRVDRLDKKLDETRGGVSASRASTDTRLNQLSERLDAVVGKLEESQVRMTSLGLNMETLKQRSARQDSIRQAQGQSTGSNTLDPDKAYEAAYSDYSAGRYKLAVDAFKEYLRNYPDTDVSDNAQYLIGESLYAQGEFGAAIIEYRVVVDKYSKGDKVPAALLKIGSSNARLGNKTEAKKSYQQVIQKYPKSPEAALAKERLAQLK